MPRIPKGVQVYAVNGPFFFGASDKLKDVTELGKPPLLEAVVEALDDAFGVAGATMAEHADQRKERKQTTSDQGRADVR